MPAHIELNAGSNNQERIDYLKMVLDKDYSMLELIDSHRSKNLAHALVTFAAAFGATLKFLTNADPYLIGTSLFILVLCFFLRDFQLHKYGHGWNGTIREHLKKLEFVINNPKISVAFESYYKAPQREVLSWKEWFSFNRFIYYLLSVGAISAGIIVSKGWVR